MVLPDNNATAIDMTCGEGGVSVISADCTDGSEAVSITGLSAPGADTTAIHDDTAGEISAIAAKASPVAADFFVIEDSAAANAKKSITMGDIDHDALTNFLAAEHIDWASPGAGTIDTDNYIEGGAGTDTTAIHDDTASEISAITAKASPVLGDFLVIEDSEAGNVKKSITIGDLPSGATDSIMDADGDTKIQTEESTDEDVIRFDTAGNERMSIQAGGDVRIIGDTMIGSDADPDANVILQVEDTSNSRLHVTNSSAGASSVAQVTIENEVSAHRFSLQAQSASAAGDLLGIARADNAFLQSIGLGALAIGTFDAADVYLSTNDTVRIQIESGGDGDVIVFSPLAINTDDVTIADNATPAVPATLTYAPSTSMTEITCNDADTCDVTMDETGAQQGQTWEVCNVSVNVVDFADTLGVSELAGAFAAGQYDCLALRYLGDRWVETSRSDN